MSTERKLVNRQQQLREMLHTRAEGISEENLLALVREHSSDYRRNVLHRVLQSMDDVYIARWVNSPVRLRYVPVWAAVHVPPDAPMPDKAPPSATAFRKIIQRSTCNE
jgi:hypothetical protein